MFSSPIRWTDLKADKDGGIDLDLKVAPGTRVEGRLDDSVVRPVKRGRVRAFVASPGFGDQATSQSEELGWEEWADIRPDGSFVFESLPSNEQVEMIAFCDGYFSKSLDGDDFLVAATRFQSQPVVQKGMVILNLLPCGGARFGRLF